MNKQHVHTEHSGLGLITLRPMGLRDARRQATLHFTPPHRVGLLTGVHSHAPRAPQQPHKW